ncbi:cytoskeletal protein binding protein [Knufia obscura]|uniref:Actin cytoskeleton-regulatory complex protein SLA1 n=2 Tax=Knufia TaxID=430999 RepID=A0AAN8E9C0_9EURO|nr:cytoskeletal protein binding protein [Knufia obscura]KAK5948295.1 cytoskeletal protein binding protein [Knufia fluminis]
MGFLSICTALYDYQPQSDGELELKEGDILYILEKSAEDDWWKAKKRAAGEDEDEPEGLIPNNYVEDAQAIHTAKALYDYTRQTEEEVSFTEDAVIHVYDTSDPDWTLVAVDGDYGFAPANYIEVNTTSAVPQSPAIASPRATSYAAPSAPEPQQQPSPPASPIHDRDSAQARLAGIMGGVAPASPPATRQVISPPLPPRQPTPEPADEQQPPPKPARPVSQTVPAISTTPSISYQEDDSPGIQPSPAFRGMSNSSPDPLRSPGGYHLYNISEMVSAMGKRKKMPITLGLNIATGTIMLSPEKSRDGPTQEWSADKLEHYSIEGKHVFLELNRPSKSLDLHAGAKDTAKEIVAGLGDIAGAHRAVGLQDVIKAAAGGGQKKGVVSYDFMAQGDDEVTVAEGDEVVVLDDTKSEEWWNVRRLKNGKEGVVPSSYIEIIGLIAVEPPSRSGLNAGLSPVEQNRKEEERLAKEAARADRARRAAEEARAQREVSLPERGSSLGEEDRRSSKKDKRSSKSDGKPRSKPDQSKIRTWTDHSGSFKVDAQFLGVADGKIHLHKVNGVKIAVPAAKMSQVDLDYVEKVTNEPIDDNIPVADLIKMKRRNQEASRAGASIDRSRSPAQQNKPPDYDWFDFFLTAGVGPHQCERYAQAMVKDSMDESVLPDISMENLRTLGLKEGDAIKVMKHLDQRLGRNRANGDVGSGPPGGLFTNPDGTLKKNTGRERPDANRAGTDKVDATTFQPEGSKAPGDAQQTPLASAPPREVKDGFDDDAWTPKPAARAVTPSAPAPAPAPAAKPSANMQDLALLTPLEPTPAPQRPASQPQAPQIAQSPPPAPQQQQPTGATPGLFQEVANQVGQPQSNPRQRPQPPQQSYAGLLSPPPRPTSAPQNAQQNQFGLQPLQAQLTGVSSNTHPAPAGQSLDELTAQRMQQFLRPQQTGFMQPAMQMQNGFQPQPTGFQQPQFSQMPQPYLNGNAAGSPFADPRSLMQPQPTGFNNFQQQPQQTGINSMLPPALTPQRTGFPNAQPHMQQNGINQFQPQQTGFQPQGLHPQPTGFQSPFQAQQTGIQQPLQSQPTSFGHTNGFGNSGFPPVPPIPQSTTPAPLVPQKTGPAPDIKFGVNPAAKRLVPQPTGRADLSKATPQNPFGF